MPNHVIREKLGVEDIVRWMGAKRQKPNRFSPPKKPPKRGARVGCANHRNYKLQDTQNIPTTRGRRKSPDGCSFAVYSSLQSLVGIS